MHGESQRHDRPEGQHERAGDDGNQGLRRKASALREGVGAAVGSVEPRLVDSLRQRNGIHGDRRVIGRPPPSCRTNAAPQYATNRTPSARRAPSPPEGGRARNSPGRVSRYGLPPMRPPIPLALEAAAAARRGRALARRRPRRRHDAAREAALEARPGRDRPARAPAARRARCSSRRRTARRRPRRWWPRSCARGPRSRTTAPGANLVSGVASTLLRADGAELGLFEVDEAALPEVARRVRPKALLLGQPLPRPARPLRRARDRRRALARRRRDAARRRRSS